MKKIIITLLCAFLSMGILTGCSPKKDDTLKETEQPTLMTFNEGKTYDQSSYASGIITVSDVVIKNTTFSGDLTIDKSVGEGDVTLDGVKVNGKLIIEGGGSNSIHIDNSDIKSMESGKAGSAVRIVISENSKVETVDLGGETNLEVSGQVTNLSVKPDAKATDIALQPNSKVTKVEVNAPTSLLVQAPITDLNLKAESKVSLEAAVENVRVEAAAQNTTMTVAKDVEVKNLATETKIDVSGEGKLTNVITTDTNNVTGNIKAETTTVNENPIQESNKEVVTATPTPQPTTAPKPTAVPTKAPATPVPTVEPTPVPPSTPSTPKPTAVPTPTYTVNFVLDGYSVDSQSIKQGEKITKPVVSLKDDVYAGSYVLWLDDLGNIYDFNASVTSAKTLTGKITVDATSENIVAIVADTRVSAMNLTQDITLDKGLTISRDLAIFGNNTKLTITSGDAFIVDNKTKFSLNNLTVDAIGKDSRGISIGYDIDFDITLNSTVLLTNARGISNSGVEDKSKTEKLQSNIFLNNSEIRNKRITDIETDVIYESSRGISLFDSVGTVSINSSKIYGYQYGINVGGDNPRAEDNSLGLNVTVLNSNINAWGALNVWGSYGNYLVKGSTLKGINKMVGGANSFSTIVLNNDIYGIFDNQKAFGNKMTIEDSTVTNYQTDESKLSGLSQNLIRVDCGLDKLEFKGVVNLIDSTDYLNSSIYLDNMESKEEVDSFVNNSLVTTGATINSKAGTNKELPLVDNPYVLPIISNAKIAFDSENENIVVEFDLDKGFIMRNAWGIKDNTALTAAYTKLLMNGITWESSWELGNDVVLNYYYLDDNDVPVSLLTEDGNPLVKNKYWDGYLNYHDGTETKRLEAGTLLPLTYIGERVLNNKTWSTSTNPLTGTVSEGWLDAAQGHKVYVDIVVVYNYEVIKQTLNIDIPRTSSVWDGNKVDTSWFNDEQTTFELTKAEELAGLSQLVNNGNSFSGKTIVLTNNINLNKNNWTPIGQTANKAFLGTFDGNGKTISNLKSVNAESVSGTGLFGGISGTGIVKNLTINNVELMGKENVGAVSGLNNGKIQNVNIIGNVQISGNYKVGGVVGEGYGVIDSCSINASANSSVSGIYLAEGAEGDNVGGIIGYTGEQESSAIDKIINCSTNVNVEGTRKVGGLVGFLHYGVGIKDSYATGNVKTNTSSEYAAAKKISIGGLVGEVGTTTMSNVSKIENSYATGNVIGIDNSKTGSLVGYIRNDDGAVKVISSHANESLGLSLVGGAYVTDDQITYIRIPGDVEISNFVVEYRRGENIVVKFSLNNDVYLDNYNVDTSQAIQVAYTDLLTSSEAAKISAAVKNLGNDIILVYYTEIDGNRIPVMTGNNTPLIKNKLWSGYICDSLGNPMSDGIALDGQPTSIGTKVSATSWQTWTNPSTIQPIGWLDNIDILYVDLIIINNGTITKQTQSVKIPLNPDVMVLENVDPIKVGESKDLSLKIPATNEKEVSWTTSDEKIVSIDSQGRITGNDVGKVTISATHRGITKTIEVEVVADEPVQATALEPVVESLEPIDEPKEEETSIESSPITESVETPSVEGIIPSTDQTIPVDQQPASDE